MSIFLGVSQWWMVDERRMLDEGYRLIVLGVSLWIRVQSV
jgi:hypothetical protein